MTIMIKKTCRVVDFCEEHYLKLNPFLHALVKAEELYNLDDNQPNAYLQGYVNEIERLLELAGPFKVKSNDDNPRDYVVILYDVEIELLSF